MACSGSVVDAQCPSWGSNTVNSRSTAEAGSQGWKNESTGRRFWDMSEGTCAQAGVPQEQALLYPGTI